jgi:hypothetical protein
MRMRPIAKLASEAIPMVKNTVAIPMYRLFPN